MQTSNPLSRARAVTSALALVFMTAACGGDDAPIDDGQSDAGEDQHVRTDGGKATGAVDTRDASVGGLDGAATAAPPRADAATTAPDTTADAAVGVSGIDPVELEALRQVCVDTINMYRATLGLAPLMRATKEQEVCSDRGSEKDGLAKVAHGSAGSKNPCASEGKKGFPGFSAQDTCPGWPVGRRGSATIADALKKCLMSMWNEGEPPEGTAQCIAEYRKGDAACFEAHGHYINMSSTTSKVVSCGFYDMGMSTYWMNQDFQ